MLSTLMESLHLMPRMQPVRNENMVIYTMRDTESPIMVGQSREKEETVEENIGY